MKVCFRKIKIFGKKSITLKKKCFETKIVSFSSNTKTSISIYNLHASNKNEPQKFIHANIIRQSTSNDGI